MAPALSPTSRISPLLGAAFVAASGACFGAMAIFSKLAFDAGVGVVTALVLRFLMASAVLGVVSAVRRRSVELPRGRTLVAALGLGAVGYAAQSGLFFWALTRMDAGVVALALYTYPALVTIGAVALGRDRLDAVRVLALLLAFAGLALVLFVDRSGSLEALGVVLALGAAGTYTGYILTSERVLPNTEPIGLSTVVCAGAAASLLTAGVLSGEIDLSFEPIGWLWLAAIAVVSTVLGIALFFAGLGAVGPSRASIISTVEPPVTILLAFIVFGEQLSATQLVGGAIVLASVVLLQVLGGHPEPPLAAPAPPT